MFGLIKSCIRSFIKWSNSRVKTAYDVDLRYFTDDVRKLKHAHPELSLRLIGEYGGSVIEHIKVQPEEVCLAAVKSNFHALKFVKAQTYEVCLAAVRKNPFALELIRNTRMREKVRRISSGILN